jgi:hypothetical protein
MTATASLGGAAAGPRRRVFYTAMALLVAAYVLYGFGRSYAASLAPPGLPVWVHLHGLAFTSWIALFVAQTWLVGRGGYALHRRLGWASLGLVGAMMVLGVSTTLLCVRRGAVPPFFTPGLMLALDFLGLAGFGALYGAGVVLRRRPEWHKRLMLCATILLSTPALARIIHLGPLGKAAPFVLLGALLALTALGALYDLLTRRAPHPAYAWGAAAMAASILLAGPLGFSAPMHALVRALTT